MKRLSYITIMAALLLAGCTGKTHKIAITAHRGFWNCEQAGYMENTIASLAQAQENGFWGSEFDVHITGDDQLLVNHNADLGGLNIHDTPIDSFLVMVHKNGEHPSTVGQYLEQGAKGSAMLVYEIKPNPSEEKENLLVDKTIETLKDHCMYDPDKVMFISFSLNICKRIAEKCPGFTNQFLADDEFYLTPDEVHAAGINGIDYEYHMFYSHPEWIARAHELGMSVNVWTVDAKEDMQAMIDLGVDCITTNYPLLARELLGERELKR